MHTQDHAPDPDPDERCELRWRRAHLLTPRLVTWPWPVHPELTYRLHHARDGGMRVADGHLVGADAEVTLRSGAGTLATQIGAAAAHTDGVRHLADRAVLLLDDDVVGAGTPGADLRHPLGWLAGQLVVTATPPGGEVVAATGVQHALALDAVTAAVDAPLGPVWEDPDAPQVRVWAPTARSVRLHRGPAPGWDTADPPAPPGPHHLDVHPLHRDERGVWTVTGSADWHGNAYRFEVEVYDPAEDRVVSGLVTDPWGLATTADGEWSVLVDLGRVDDPALAPRGWDGGGRAPATAGQARMVVYELHLRDLSAADPSVPEELRGTYRALELPGSHGVRHLRRLAEAGVTHLHLLPVHDMGSVPERRGDQVVPRISPPEDPACELPQQLQQATADRQAFNWGYDPQHFMVPEGAYATDPDGPQRISEFRALVAAVHRLGLRVVVDLVCNHTYRAGRHPQSVLDRIVPGYYHRLDDLGRITTSTCCPNTATEHLMMDRLVLDTVLTWARAYRVDGFRFDLFGHHPAAQARRIRAALDELTPERDGVAGRDIVLYGEGWDFGEVAGDARFDQATQRGLAGTGIGTFDDRLRDAVRGGNHAGSRREQGFASGLWWEPNGAAGGEVVGVEVDRADRGADPAARDTTYADPAARGADPAARDTTAADPAARGTDPAARDTTAAALRRAHELTDRVRLGIAGNLAEVEVPCADGITRRGCELEYGGSPAGYARRPQDQVAYVSAHDNETLYDTLAAKLPVSLPMTDRVRMQVVALSTVLLGQGTPFLHAGSELLRSKSLDRNSYRSGDWFNAVDWSGQRTSWGIGMPPQASNPDERPLLADLLRRIPPPGPADIAACRERVLELLRVRSSSRLFGLPDLAAVQQRLTFHLTGAEAMPGVVVWALHGAGSVDHDLLVVLNAAPVALDADWSRLGDGEEPETAPSGVVQRRPLFDRAAPWSLHPVLARSIDPVLRRTEVSARGLRVAARTPVVFRRTSA